MDPDVIRRMRSSYRYQRWRAAILRDEPLCRPCAEAGFTVAVAGGDRAAPGRVSGRQHRHVDAVGVGSLQDGPRSGYVPGVRRSVRREQRMTSTNSPALVMGSNYARCGSKTLPEHDRG